MELILWRHADAEEGARDLERKLTAKGRRQAARMSKWLAARLPSKYAVYSSPARRARETADALGVRYRIADRLAPGAPASAILAAAGWPDAKGTAIVVGHQPDLGRVLAALLNGRPGEWSIRKGAIWWLGQRKREGGTQVVVRAAIAPDLL
jgi:phosphohistidine phosphatase